MDESKKFVLSNDNKNDCVFIIATGRSGSTTLLRILNTIDNFKICGENAGMILNLMDFYSNLKRTNIHYISNDYKYFIKNNIKPAWYNIYDENEVKFQLKKLIKTLYKVDDLEENIVWGFKDIRIPLEDFKFCEYIYNLKELFPNAKFIFGYRENVEQQSKSQWWNSDSEKFKKIIENKNFFMKDFAKKNCDYCFVISLENILNKDENFYNMFKFLKCNPALDPKIDEIDLILKNNLG